MERMVKTGIVGAGGLNIATSSHLPASLAVDKIKLIALCDVNEEVCKYAREAGVKPYLDYQEFLKDPELEMVQIATPDWLHCAQAEKALEAGKHVLLQKPPCMNPEEIVRLKRALSKSSGSLKIILNQRETRISRTIKKYLEAGAIGELREIIIKYRGRRFPIQNLNSPYLKAVCGGVWRHNALHWLDEAYFYSEILPDAVQAFSCKNENGAPQYLGDGPNYWSAFFHMGKTTFQFEYNTMLMRENMPGGMFRALIGAEGEIRCEYGSDEIRLYRKGSKDYELCDWVPREICREDDAIDSFSIALEKYAQQIIDGNEAPPEMEASLYLMNAIFAGAESAESGKAIKLEELK